MERLDSDILLGRVDRPPCNDKRVASTDEVEHSHIAEDYCSRQRKLQEAVYIQAVSYYQIRLTYLYATTDQVQKVPASVNSTLAQRNMVVCVARKLGGQSSSSKLNFALSSNNHAEFAKIAMALETRRPRIGRGESTSASPSVRWSRLWPAESASYLKLLRSPSTHPD